MQKIVKISSILSCTFLITTSLFFSGCSSSENNKMIERTKYVVPDSLLRTLSIEPVTKCQLSKAVILTGKVAFNDDNVVKIYPMVSGNVQGIKVVLGDYITAGQILAIINSTEMAGYGNDYINAESNLRVAIKTLEKTKDMYKSGLASLTDSLSAEVGYEQAKSALTRINSVLKINGGNAKGQYVIKAPISGFLVEKFVTNNMVIRADNTTNLFTISDLKNVWVMANVYESNISEVHLGDDVDVTTLSYPGKIFKGKVDKVFNVLDPTNKVMKLRIVLPNPTYSLKPEMFANVTVSNKENRQVLCISSKALVFDHSQYYVLVFNSKSDIKITPVEIINTVGDKTYIAKGINEGDKVISSQAILIYDALNN